MSVKICGCVPGRILVLPLAALLVTGCVGGEQRDLLDAIKAFENLVEEIVTRETAHEGPRRPSSDGTPIDSGRRRGRRLVFIGYFVDPLANIEDSYYARLSFGLSYSGAEYRHRTGGPTDVVWSGDGSGEADFRYHLDFIGAARDWRLIWLRIEGPGIAFESSLKREPDRTVENTEFRRFQNLAREFNNRDKGNANGGKQ